MTTSAHRASKPARPRDTKETRMTDGDQLIDRTCKEILAREPSRRAPAIRLEAAVHVAEILDR